MSPMSETLYVLRRGKADYEEHSTHADIDAALTAGKALLQGEDGFTHVRVGGEVWVRDPLGAIVEVMQD